MVVIHRFDCRQFSHKPTRSLSSHIPDVNGSFRSSKVGTSEIKKSFEKVDFQSSFFFFQELLSHGVSLQVWCYMFMLHSVLLIRDVDLQVPQSKNVHCCYCVRSSMTSLHRALFLGQLSYILKFILSDWLVCVGLYVACHDLACNLMMGRVYCSLACPCILITFRKELQTSEMFPLDQSCHSVMLTLCKGVVIFIYLWFVSSVKCFWS